VRRGEHLGLLLMPPPEAADQAWRRLLALHLVTADHALDAAGDCCRACQQCSGAAPVWLAAARRARLLASVSLAWMSAEGAAGLVAGAREGSVALTGWALWS
jgi:hypothetical protein